MSRYTGRMMFSLFTIVARSYTANYYSPSSPTSAALSRNPRHGGSISGMQICCGEGRRSITHCDYSKRHI